MLEGSSLDRLITLFIAFAFGILGSVFMVGLGFLAFKVFQFWYKNRKREEILRKGRAPALP